MTAFVESTRTRTPSQPTATPFFNDAIEPAVGQYSILTIPPFEYTVFEGGTYIYIDGSVVAAPTATDWWRNPHTFFEDGIHIANITLPYPSNQPETSTGGGDWGLPTVTVDATFTPPTLRSTSDPLASEPPQHGSKNGPWVTGQKIGVIIGGVVGSAIALSSVAAVIIILKRQRKRQKAALITSDPSEETSPLSTEKTIPASVQITSTV